MFRTRQFELQVLIASFICITISFTLPRLFSLFLNPMNLMEGVSIALIGTALGGFLDSFTNLKLSHHLRKILPLALLGQFLTPLFFTVTPLTLTPYFISLIIIGCLISESFRSANLYRIMVYDMFGGACALIVIIFIPEIGIQNFYLIICSLSLPLLFLNSRPQLDRITSYGISLLVLSALIVAFQIDLLRDSQTIREPESLLRNGQHVLRSGGKHLGTEMTYFARVDAIQPLNQNDISYFYDNWFFTSSKEKQNFTLPHIKLEQSNRAMVIGVGGGMDLVSLHKLGYSEIEAAELNDGMIRLMTTNTDIQDLVGKPYDLAKVHNVDGRSYLLRKHKPFDYISLNYADSRYQYDVPVIFTEAYLYTSQAFHTYWNALSDNGVLFISNKLRLDSTNPSTILLILRNLNHSLSDSVQDIKKHVLALTRYRQNENTLSTNIYLYIKKKPWTEDEKDIVYRAIESDPNYRIIYPEGKEETFREATKQIDEALTISTSNKAITDNSPFLYVTDTTKLLNSNNLLALTITTLLLGLIVLLYFFKKQRLLTKPALTAAATLSLLGLASGGVQMVAFHSLSLSFQNSATCALFILALIFLAGTMSSIFKLQKSSLIQLFHYNTTITIAVFYFLPHDWQVFLAKLGYFSWALIAAFLLPWLILNTSCFLLLLARLKGHSIQLSSLSYSLSMLTLVSGMVSSQYLPIFIGFRATWILLFCLISIASYILLFYSDKIRSKGTDL